MPSAMILALDAAFSCPAIGKFHSALECNNYSKLNYCLKLKSAVITSEVYLLICLFIDQSTLNLGFDLASVEDCSAGELSGVHGTLWHQSTPHGSLGDACFQLAKPPGKDVVIDSIHT